MRIVIAATVVAVLATACGAQHHAQSHRVIVEKYGDFGAETITVPNSAAANDRLCKVDAEGFATEAQSFVMRFGSTAASSTDVYYMGLREELADFDARRCAASVLGKALVQRLTAKQRRLFVSELTRSMAGRVRAALGAA